MLRGYDNLYKRVIVLAGGGGVHFRTTGFLKTPSLMETHFSKLLKVSVEFFGALKGFVGVITQNRRNVFVLSAWFSCMPGRPCVLFITKALFSLAPNVIFFAVVRHGAPEVRGGGQK